MMSSGDLDLTINVKTTQGLVNNADFFPKPFSVLTLALYNYANATEKSISAIRAFDYNGYRDKLQNDGFRFIDVPTAEDAVELFVRRRSQHLISYKTPYDYYLMANDVKFETQVNTTVLQNIPTYIAISRMSAHRLKLLDWLSTIDSNQFESLLEMAEHL
jgi:polar amino acid transport system substrate-binding protein